MTSPQPFREFVYDAGSGPKSPGGGSARLNELLARYDTAKDEADAAAVRLKTIADAIKSELTTGYADASGPYAAYRIASPDLRRPLCLRWVVAERFDTKAFRLHHADLAAQYTTPTGSWRLARGAE